MTDSARWCETCNLWGDHHTDRHPFSEIPNLWLKTKDQELAERVKDQMPRNPDLRWYVAESGDPEFPWGLFNELVRYGDGAMAEQEAA